MDTLIVFLEITIDAIALYLCCNGVFRKSAFKNKSDILFPLLIMLLFIMTRADWLIIDHPSVSFRLDGCEIVHANNVYLLVIQMIFLVIVNSICYKSTDNGMTLCGTMAAYSVYLLTRTVAIVFFSFYKGTGNLLSIGSRLLTIVLIGCLIYSPIFEWIHQGITSGGFAARFAVSNIVAVFISRLLSSPPMEAT